MNLFYQPQIDEGVNYLDADESRHCIKVLRKHEGDALHITDGKGFFYDAVITRADPSKCIFHIAGKTAAQKKDFTIHLAISPTKNTDRIEWCVEKSVEMGVDQITLIECKNTERAFVKAERLKKVAVSAMKQSLKANLPHVNPLMPLTELFSANTDQKFIAFVDQSNPLHLFDAAVAKQNYLVLIGPEGDFTKEELADAEHHGFVKVILGESRLRTETAGIAACHILNLVNR